ncbi:MAG: S8 family serine peptidase [Actinobacteria bacterium]|nr:S8 family serine peptidase [Actinomycetota bacterium]
MEHGPHQGSRRRLGAWLACALTLALAVPADAARSTGEPVDTVAGDPLEAPPAPDHVLVKLEPGADPDRLPGEAERTGVPGWVEVPVRPSQAPEEVVARLEDKPVVRVAEPDPVITLDAVRSTSGTSDDPLIDRQWNLPVVRAQQAWPRSTGARTRVAVVDTGISHGSDLSCRSFTTGFDAITDTGGDGVAGDDHGHGTHVAGTVAQCTNNGRGVAGIAYRARLMPVKVLNRHGQGTASDIAQGIVWARRRGADVVNLSLGGDCNADFPDCSVGILNDAVQAAADAGVVVAAASGNADKPHVGTPANHPAAVAVGSVDHGLRRSWFSNYGKGLDLTAPGGGGDYDYYKSGVLQQTLGSACGALTRRAYCLFQGTSMATPHVSAAAAMLRAHRRSASRIAIKRALQRGALDRGPAGRDRRYGSGVLRIDRALDRLR